MSPSNPPWTAHVVAWRDGEAMLSELRREVFVVEQGVPHELEWDGEDGGAIHLIVRDPDAGDNGTAIGCARLLAGDDATTLTLGRMAVRVAFRGRGVGAALLRAAEAVAGARGITTLHLSAQCHALGFYTAAGYVAHGPVFDDAGIPHRRMRKALSDIP